MARKKAKANYFTKETEEFIVRYNLSTDSTYRGKVFTEHIYLPFYKLAENIIHTFKFYYTDVEKIEDLKHEVVSVLLEEKIMKFEIELDEINTYKMLKQIGSFDDMEESYEGSMDVKLPGGITLSQFLDMWVEKTYDKLDGMFPKDYEKNIADAVLTIFKTRNDLDIFKKKALYIYIREMTDCETPHLTKVVALLKEDFYSLYYKYHEKGRIVIKEL